MMDFLKRMQGWLDQTKAVDFLGPLALRLYLVPVFWVAGMNKVNGFENTAAWFGSVFNRYRRIGSESRSTGGFYLASSSSSTPLRANPGRGHGSPSSISLALPSLIHCPKVIFEGHT